MSKTKNILRDKLINLKAMAKDGRKQAFFALFLVLSLTVMYIVYANDPHYTVTTSNIKITTPNQNAAGEEIDLTNVDNAEVKSYSSIKYTMDYLVTDSENTENSTEESSESTTSIKVKIELPINAANVKVNDNYIEPTLDGDRHVYEQTIENVLVGATYSNLTITVDNIYSGSLIKPEIYIKAGGSDYQKILNKEFRINSEETSNLDLFVGGKSNDSSTIPVGVVAYMDNDLTGKAAPRSVDYNLSVKVNDEEKFSSESSVTTYKSGSTMKVNGMPYSSNSADVSYEINNNTITASNISFDQQNVYGDMQRHLLVSSVIPINIGTISSATNVEITLSRGNFSKTISYTLYPDKVLGDVSSDIKTTKDDKEDSVFNIGEEFIINTKVSYANNNSYSADKLDNLTTYIKLDNNAIKTINYENNIPVEVTDEKGNVLNPTISYGVGLPNATNFKISENAPSGCPTELTSDNIIKYYGGPCVEETSSYQWKDSLTQSEEDVYDVSIIKLEFNNDIDPNTEITIKMKAKIKDEFSQVGQTFNIYTSSMTKHNDRPYYLYGSSIITGDDTSVGQSDNTMVNGPFTSKGITTSILKTKVSINSFDLNDNTRDSFTLGLNDPIKWKINVKTLLSSLYSSTNPTVNVRVEIIIPGNLKLQTTNDTQYTSLTKKEGTESTYECIISNANLEEEIVFVTGISELISNKEDTTIIAIAESNALINESTITSGNNEDSRTATKVVTLHNENKISLVGNTDPHLFNEDTPYTYTMTVYNNSLPSGQMSMISALPYEDFNGDYTVSIISAVPGYNYYYTTDEAKNIYANEKTNRNTWNAWNNPTETMSGITGIKIVSQNAIGKKQYFASDEGVSVLITPSNNKRGDKYVNNFIIIDKDNNTYASKNSEVSVYDRKISGFTFNDDNYNGQYDDEEKNISDLPVELYKANITGEYDINQTPNYISETDEKIDETLTDTDGTYSFSGLEEGIYYVKVKFDTERYTVTSYQVENSGVDNILDINSKYLMLPNTDYAVSKLVVLNDNNLKSSNINLGLRTKQIFDISINKYITNVKVIKNNSEKNYSYDKAKQVKIDLKDLKNTKIQVTYGFELKNTKYFPGYVGDIVESIPYGMKFDSSLKENTLWEGNSEYLHYKGLDNMLIMPDNSYHFKIVLEIDGETAGYYINVVSAGNLRLMELLQ